MHVEMHMREATSVAHFQSLSGSRNHSSVDNVVCIVYLYCLFCLSFKMFWGFLLLFYFFLIIFIYKQYFISTKLLQL